jgi:hypothetical protein
MAKLISLDLEELRQTLKEKNPEKLHQKADEILQVIEKHSEELMGTDVSVLSLCYSIAAFLEARAAYLALRKK